MGFATNYIGVTLLLFLVLISPSACRSGYDIFARVDGSIWEIHRSIQNMQFSTDGKVSGNGNFSKFCQVADQTGINAKERSHSLDGTLDSEEKLLMRTREGPVNIQINLESADLPDMDQPEEGTKLITAGSYAEINIDERWSAYLAYYKKISYLGPGISTREFYGNNGDVVSSTIDSWRLTKESLYRAHLNRTIIESNIYPGSVNELRYSNTSCLYNLNLKSMGSKTSLDLSRRRYYPSKTVLGRPEVYSALSQDYIGEQEMQLKVNMNKSVIKPDEEKELWLDCCSGDTLPRPNTTVLLR